VLELKFGALEARFGVALPPQSTEHGSAPTLAEKVPEKTIQAQQQAEALSHEEQEIRLREDQIAELLLTDPLKAEELMENGELMPTGDADGEDTE
jgi:hypothetical protein